MIWFVVKMKKKNRTKIHNINSVKWAAYQIVRQHDQKFGLFFDGLD